MSKIKFKRIKTYNLKLNKNQIDILIPLVENDLWESRCCRGDEHHATKEIQDLLDYLKKQI